MRKIEEEMVLAVVSKNDWKSGNTRVQFKNDILQVFLFDNMILECGAGRLTISMCGWGSVTTRSRLNALFPCFEQTCLWRVFQKDRIQFLDMEEVIMQLNPDYQVSFVL